MEESYETFEEELWPPRADPPPQKPVRQIHRPETYATRKFKEEMAPVPQQQAEPKTLPREPSFPRTTSLQKTLSIQNLTQTTTPWDNVTLNRCLFVVITILVLTSGLQRLHETLRGQGTAEEEKEVRLTVRRSGTLRHRGQPPEPETSLWNVMFWWLPDLDDDEEEDDDGEVKRGRLTKKATARASRGFRNKPMPDKNLLKQRGGELKHRGTKKANDEKSKGNKGRDKKDELKAEGDEDRVESDDEEAARKSNKVEKKKNSK